MKPAVNGNNKQWFSTLPTLWNHLQSFKNTSAGPHPQRSDLICLGASVAPETFESTLGDPGVLPRLGTAVPTAA